LNLYISPYDIHVIIVSGNSVNIIIIIYVFSPNFSEVLSLVYVNKTVLYIII